MTMRRVHFLTHADVEIDPDVPVQQWPLNARGRARHAAFAHDPELASVTGIYSSRERKALDAAAIHAEALQMVPRAVTDLHENDRSATGFLPKAEFERTADAFFAHPDQSIRGWERATDARTRIATAVRTVVEMDASAGDILIVAHGGVGALMRCALKARAVTRAEDQPGAQGGCHFAFDAVRWADPTEWREI